MRFDDMVNTYIKKNADVLNIPKHSLCTQLFSFEEGTPPVLLESVRLQLLNDIERISPYIKVLRFYLTGETIAPTSIINPKSDVSVAIGFANYNNDITSQHRAYSMTKKLSNKYIDRSQHKVFYYLYEGDLNLNNLNGAFDIVANKWIKVPAIEDEDLDTNN